MTGPGCLIILSCGVSMITNPPANRDKRLRPYQQEGVQFLRRARGGGILYWDMRTGKTRTALCAPKKFKRMVIVAPKVTEGVWVEECKTIYGREPVVVEGREFGEIPDEPIIWMNYEIVSTRWSWFLTRPIDLLVLDEAQYIKNKRSQRTQGVHALASCARRVLALTGTPIMNRPVDLWGILWAVQAKEWPSYYDFARRYCDGQPTGYGGFRAEGLSMRHRRELAAKLDAIMHRVRWCDIVESVPKLDRIRIPVVLNDNTLARAKTLQRDLRAALDGYRGSASPQKAARLRQVSQLRLTIGKGKVKPTVEFVRTVPEDEKVVIWTHHHDVADAIADKLSALGSVARLHGKQTAKKRKNQIAWFRAEARFMVVSLEAGGVGIDLSVARIAVFAELSWTPAVLAQAEKRTYTGEEDRVCAMYYMVARETIEDRILDLLDEKVRLVYDALDDSELLTLVNDVSPHEEDTIESILDIARGRAKD